MMMPSIATRRLLIRFLPRVRDLRQVSLSSQIHTAGYTPSKSKAPATLFKPPYVVKDEPCGAKAALRVIIIGAGVSGIDMLRALKRHTRNVSYTIYEKNPKVGGTWYENQYPGCASDDPSHSYQYTHSPNQSWSSIFAPAREIEKYLNEVVDNNGIRSNINCGHRIEEAKWNKQNAEWEVTVTNETSGERSVDRGHFLIDATGVFNDWKWPDVKQLHSFKGDLIHTANWPTNFDYQGKTVAVIGNGASGVQIVPAIQPKVKKLFHFIRTKTWIPPPGAAFELCQQHTDKNTQRFSLGSIMEFKANPSAYSRFVKELDRLAAKDRFKTIVDPIEADDSRDRITKYMASALGSNQDLISKLIPSFPVGCRRITASSSYLNSLTASNVSVITSPIRTFMSPGIELVDREVVECDAIICATGFNTSFIPRFPILGEDGTNLQDLWSEECGGPTAYMSCMVERMPNYFRFIGPNGPLAHGAIPQLSSHISKYVLSHIRKLQTEQLSSIHLLPSAVKEFNEHVQAFIPRTAWAGGDCGGWYKSKGSGEKEGRVTALHPGSQKHWERMLKHVRWEDFEFRRKGENRFTYLGNGFTAEEVAEGEA